MIKRIDSDAMYPFYYFVELEGYGRSVDIPEELVNKYEAVLEAFDDVQTELKKLYDAADSKEAGR